jgi:cobalt-precorrin-5B (C1)-methyltransferase
MARKLRTGFTTGTAAAAATKGALLLLLEGKPPATVLVELLTGDTLAIHVHTCRLQADNTAICTVIKDAGDDPDVTHKAEIGARVTLLPAGSGASEVIIRGGEGVGRVTKPGLEVAPGQPAINSGPRKMITQCALDVLEKYGLNKGVQTRIFVPKGEELARKTLNARLGILGGISILGTTGIVKPMSHDAFTATIEAALSVARATGLDRAVLTTGRRSERFSQEYWSDLPEEAFVQIGDFFKMSLESAVQKGFNRITLAVFFGKALKMAQAIPHTHAAKASLTLEKLSRWAVDITGNRQLGQQISSANTARQAFEILMDCHPEVIYRVGEKIRAAAKGFSAGRLKIQSVIFDYEGCVAFDSEKQSDLQG